MKVILTEKPSVARDIAKCLKISGKKDGYMEGNGTQITWAFGHLVELKEPNDYDPSWKRWALDTLPMIPEKFGLKPKDDAGAKKQLKTIKGLFKEADEIICATDAGREGELIFRYILAHCQCTRKPIKRLWISSMTDEAIKKGMENLKDGQQFNSLFEAAQCRSEADWIVGLNATRYYTIHFGQNRSLWSLGRVQTPILNMIVGRDLEIENFVPEDFYEVCTKYRETIFKHQKGRFSKQEDAQKIIDSIKDHPFEITKVVGKQEKVNPPLLFDLTDLQKELNRLYGYTADHVLKLAQTLYERKHITYPRTDSRYLTNDMKSDTKELLTKLKSYAPELIEPLDLTKLNDTKRIYNDANVSDHHAIIPTNVLPNNLSPDETNLYNAVLKRFASVFYPPCLKEVTTVHGKANKEPFKTTGTVIKDLGWQIIYKGQNEKDEDEKEGEKTLPLFEKGESGPHKPEIKKGKTSPPKFFTEATLLGMMETAGKTIDDEELKEALKEKGLGTPATRASIIETLITRKYIKRNKKNLVSTENGRHLIKIIQDEKIKSAALTGEWEAKLKNMEKGQYDQKKFMEEIKNFTYEIIATDANSLLDASCFGKCPLCQKQIIEGQKGFGCSGWKDGCKFVIWKKEFETLISPNMARELLQIGTTIKCHTFQVDGESIEGYLTMQPNGTLKVVKAESQKRKFAEKKVLGTCPLCQKNVVDFQKSYSCIDWREGCPTAIWKEIAGKEITAAMAKKLLNKGETGFLKGFKSKKTGKTFDANLVLIKGKVEMKFDKQS